MLSGVWTTFQAPNGVAIGNMMLLSDGTVMAHGAELTDSWYLLTPRQPDNLLGVEQSYQEGTWSTLAFEGVSRQFFPSAVLKDGNVFVLGGEFASDNTQFQPQQMSRSADIFDTLTRTWKTGIAPYPLSQFGDDPLEVLSDGRVLAGNPNGPQTEIYDPVTNSWSAGPTKYRNDQSDEESWVKLPDGSILTVDVWASNAQNKFLAERYVPDPSGGPGSWVDESNTDLSNPPPLLGSTGGELGAAVLLPNGNVLVTGNHNYTGDSALYNTATHTWSAGPFFPQSIAGGDLPAAVMPNGHVLQAEYDTTFPANGTTRIWDYDPNSSSAPVEVKPPAPFNQPYDQNYPYMLVLPTGQVLVSDEQNTLFLFTPTAQAPNPAWQATITGISGNGDGSATLTGTLLNGISEGAAYGDDAEMSSNYPIIRLTAGDGTVRYARTYNWSSTGVATGNAPETVQFTMPPDAPDVNELSVVTNGIASAPVLYVTGRQASNTITLDAITAFGSPAIDVNVNGSATIWFDSAQSKVFIATRISSSGTNDYVMVHSTPSDLSTYISGTYLDVGVGANNLDGILGPVTATGVTTFSTLYVYDQGNAVRTEGQNFITPLSTSYQVTDSGVTRTDVVESLNLISGIPTFNTYTAPINYGQLGNVIVVGGNTTNVYNVQSTASGTTTVIDAGPANDVINAGAPSNLLDGINNLTVNGNTGTTLNLDDQSNTFGRLAYPYLFEPQSTSYVVTNSNVARTNVDFVINMFGGGQTVATYNTSINYSNLAALVINGGATPNTYNVQSTAAATPTTINAGPTGDAVNAGATSNLLDGINNLTVNGNNGTTLNLDDQANTFNRIAGLYTLIPESTTYLVTNNNITRTDIVLGIYALGGAQVFTYNTSINYSNLAGLTINGGATPNTYNVQSTAAATPTTINAGPTGDAVNAGATSNLLDGINNLTVNGNNGTTLNLDDQANTFNRIAGLYTLIPESTTYLVTNNNITRTDIVLGIYAPGGAQVFTDNTSINYSNLAGLTINGGATPNTYTIRSTAAGIPTTINAGVSDDNVTVGNAANSLADIQGALDMDGQAGTNYLTFNDQGATGSPTHVLTSNSLTRSGAALMTFRNFNVQLNQGSSVASTHLFYKGSTGWDVTNNNLPGFADDNAVATDKTAYLPGSGAATFASVSSYTRGINGMMVDLAGSHGTLSANDFIFKVGNNNSPSLWATVTAPTLVTTRSGAGTGGSDRVELMWSDNAIQKTWLEVVVKGNDTLGGSNTNTGLASSYVFYFASAPGDSGAGDSGAFVTNSIDELSARYDPHSNSDKATIIDVNDFNRDRLVNTTDQQFTRSPNTTSNATAPKFINIAAGGPFAPDADALSASPIADGVDGAANIVTSALVNVGIDSSLAVRWQLSPTSIARIPTSSTALNSLEPSLPVQEYFQALGAAEAEDRGNIDPDDTADDALDKELLDLLAAR